MTLRHTIAAILFLAAVICGSDSLAIDRDQIIDPSRPSQASAASDQAMDNVFASGDSSLGVVITLLGYTVILGGLGVAAWLLFRRGVLRKPFAKGEGKLKVAETRMLGNRQFIMVVEYEDQKILLGVGPGKIDYLTNLNTYRSEFPTLEPIDQKAAGGKA